MLKLMFNWTAHIVGLRKSKRSLIGKLFLNQQRRPTLRLCQTFAFYVQVFAKHRANFVENCVILSVMT